MQMLTIKKPPDLFCLVCIMKLDNIIILPDTDNLVQWQFISLLIAYQ